MPMPQRFKDAAFGLGGTLVPIAALACVQFLLAPYTVATLGLMDPETEARAVSSLRGGIPRAYAVIALIITAYWLLAATFGRGQLLRIRSANITLALSVLAFACAMIVISTIPQPERFFKGLCPILGLSDEGLDFGFDTRSPCEDFAWEAAPIVLLGMPLVLLVASAILRVAVSRRHGLDNAH